MAGTLAIEGGNPGGAYAVPCPFSSHLPQSSSDHFHFGLMLLKWKVFLFFSIRSWTMFGWHRSVSACCLHTRRYLQEICTHIKISSTWLCFQVDSSSDERCMQIFWITLLSSALKPPFQTSVGSTCSVVVFSVGFSFNRCANCQQVRLSWCCLTEVCAFVFSTQIRIGRNGFTILKKAKDPKG